MRKSLQALAVAVAAAFAAGGAAAQYQTGTDLNNHALAFDKADDARASSAELQEAAYFMVLAAV